MCDQMPPNITWKLARSFLLPFWNDTFGIERRKLLLDAIPELKIQGHFLVAVLVSQNGNRLARVMITIVKEEDDVSADFVLETSSRQNFSEQKSLRKKSARLLGTNTSVCAMSPAKKTAEPVTRRMKKAARKRPRMLP